MDNHDNNDIDVNAISKTGKYKIKIESIDNEHEDDAALRRKKDWFLFLSMLLSLFIVFGVCIVIIFSSKSSLTSPALNAIITLSLALAGYYAGGKK